MERWEGKVAIVTGASGGIGAAVTTALLENGVTVLALARRMVRLFGLKEKTKGLKGKLHVKQCDVTKEEEVLLAFAWAKDKLGGVDILVNNAGVIQIDDVTSGSTEEFRNVLNVNVLAVAVLTREAVKSMTERGVDGHIININSVAGHYVPDVNRFGLTCSSKYAVTALTEVVRRELTSSGKKIKVTSLSPGAVDTDILTVASENKSGEPAKRETPHLEVKDIADSVIFVLSTPPHVQIAELTIRPVGEPY